MSALTPKQALFVQEQGINVDRFWSYVDRTGGPDACWPWRGAKDPMGYGRFHVGTGRNSTRLAHRIAYGLETGESPPVVRHKCDNPPCCNPDHHEAGTRLDNNRDMVERRRHAAHRGTNNPSKGEAHGSAKLTEGEVRTIRIAYENGGITQRALAAQFSVSQRTINKIVRKIGWTDL